MKRNMASIGLPSTWSTGQIECSSIKLPSKNVNYPIANFMESVKLVVAETCVRFSMGIRFHQKFGRGDKPV